MSSRALRKLENEQELLESLLKAGNGKNEGDNGSDEGVVESRRNMFALMQDLGDDDGSESEDEEEREEARPLEESRNVESSSKKKKKKKKNSRKGKKKGKTGNGGATSDGLEDQGDQLDDLIRQYKKKDFQNSQTLQGSGGESDYETASETDDQFFSFEHLKLTGNLPQMKADSGFTKFRHSYWDQCSQFFNNSFKKLDPHIEFKLLFDDLSKESLEDIDSLASTNVSPQHLKQIQRLKRLVRNWGGKDRRTVPNGPGSGAHRLQFTKIREDWLPAPRGELAMQPLSKEEVLDWQLWQRPLDWKEIVETDVEALRKHITFYHFRPLNDDTNKKAMTSFYLNIILHPDHEALISMISSQFPYFVPGLLQVSLILLRQGDRSNTSGLIQRALFVFDRALKNGVIFNSLACQLPYIYFFNRQFYLAIFRYIQLLAQRGAVGTSSEWCKALWSLSPLEDPLGCRYFIDFYLLLNGEYQYLIELAQSPLICCYKEWFALGLSLGVVLSYLNLEVITKAREALTVAFKYHPLSLAYLYIEKLAGNAHLVKGLDISGHHSQFLETKAYIARFSGIWKDSEHVNFLNTELTDLLQRYQEGAISVNHDAEIEQSNNPLFVNNIPVNLLRFAILSDESSIMTAIPESVWSDHEIFEYDILPPIPNSKESLDVIENIQSFINERDIQRSEATLMQDENLLDHIRQLSLEQFLEENPNAGIE